MRPFLILCICFLLSCGKKSETPKDILAVPKMTDVLWDVMLADELVNNNYPVDTGGIKFDTSIVLYSQIVKAHNTTQKQFKESLLYYKTRPDLMQVIIDSLSNRAVVPPPPAPLKKDSLVAM